MNCDEQFDVWKTQVTKLKSSLGSLVNTDPNNLIQHFFLQAIQQEFSKELESNKNTIKTILCLAVNEAETLSGNVRQRSAAIVKRFCSTNLLPHIRLSDIRNKAVFEIYRQCGVTVDTYFERYSSPPGTAEQNACYGHIAHGSAKASAIQTTTLSDVLTWMQITKRFFVVYDCIHSSATLTKYNLNWIGAMWKCHVEDKSLGDLIWELYLDLWYIEN
jgi:hypothetical protein